MRLNPQNVEAQNELDRLFLSNVTEQSRSAKDSLGEIPGSQTKQVNGKADWKSNPTFLSIIGVITGLCICGVPLLFLIYSNLLDSLPEALGVNPPLAVSPTSWGPPTSTPWESNTFETITPVQPVFTNTDMWQIRDLISQGKYAEAVLLLDQAIQSNPELDEAYFLRTLSHHRLMKQQRSQSEFQDYLDSALADIDQAIAIRSDQGDYYMMRQYLLVDLAGLQTYEVDAQHIAEFALENASAALNLGATLDEYPDRIYITDLIFTDRCDEAVQALQELIDQTDPANQSIGGLYHIQSQAYVCLGDVKKATQLVDKSMFNNVNMEWKYELKARYLYQAGQRDEALELLNTLIEEKPSYDGYGHFGGRDDRWRHQNLRPTVVENFMPNRNYRSLITFLGAAAGGICLSLIIGLVLFYVRAEKIFETTEISNLVATDPAQDFVSGPPEAQNTPLDEAQEALNAGQPEKVRDLLFPMIESWTSNEDRIQGYKLLGEAELAQGHPQLAAPYYEKLYFYQPTAENLYLLAAVYDMGGDIRKALAKYQELAHWENLPPEIDQEYLHFRIDDISRSLGTPVPTYTPSP